MLSRIQWPTAAVIITCLAAYVALAIAGKEVPVWLGTLVAVVGTVVAGILSPLVSKPAPELPADERPTDPDLRLPRGMQ